MLFCSRQRKGKKRKPNVGQPDLNLSMLARHCKSPLVQGGFYYLSYNRWARVYKLCHFWYPFTRGEGNGFLFIVDFSFIEYKVHETFDGYLVDTIHGILSQGYGDL